MSNFVFVEISKNSFYVSSSGTILDKDFDNVRFKIDTGCSYSTIPIRKLLVFNKDKLKDLKESDIINNVFSMETYGVESGGINHPKPQTLEEKMNCPAIKFKHKLTNFVLGGYSLPDTDIFVNYDRHGNILIGMDILSKFDIHMGISQITGKETLIAVLKSQSDKSDYYNALRDHFNIAEVNSLMAEVFRNFMKGKGYNNE